LPIIPRVTRAPDSLSKSVEVEQEAMEQRTLGQILEEKAEKNRDRIYLAYEREEVSYAELNDRANRVANGLRDLGVSKGDRVCTLLLNCPEFLYAWFGAAKLGAIEVPVNAALRGALLEHVLNHSGAHTLVATPDLLNALEPIASNLGELRQVVTTGPGAVADWVNRRFEVVSFSHLLQASGDPPEIDVKPSDPLSIMYTSGTTGPSKGVVLPHQYAYFSPLNKARVRGYRSDDIFYACLPLFHSNARFTSALPALVLDAKLALAQRFSASRFWSEVRAAGATVFNFVGAMFMILWKQEPRADDADNPVRIAQGGPVPADLYEAFERRFGLTLFVGYSMTEVSTCVSNLPGERNVRAAGKPVPGYDVRIFDEADRECPPGRVGEIVVRSEHPYTMILEYFRMPDKTLEAFRNLWFHTGDLAYRDEEGWIYYVDRKKDAIRRRGEMISSQEVEGVIRMHPKVAECAVVGVPSELSEEEVKAYIVVKEGETLEPEELVSYCTGRMAAFAIPRYLECVDALPRTETLRVQKHLLKKEGVNGRTWDRERGTMVRPSGTSWPR
jgi:crotonobetaine/carnitine-CoA ligase